MGAPFSAVVATLTYALQYYPLKPRSCPSLSSSTSSFLLMLLLYCYHADLKPANMLINRKGEVKISDFGIVRKMGDEGDGTDMGKEEEEEEEDRAYPSVTLVYSFFPVDLILTSSLLLLLLLLPATYSKHHHHHHHHY